MADKPPSRKRYERKNPTVSFRISRETKEQLDELVDDLDTTKKDWFERIINDEAQEVERVRDDAYSRGYEDACDKHRLEVPCAVCGAPVRLSPEDHDRVYEILEQLSEDAYTARPPSGHPLIWRHGHEDCVGD